MFVQIGSINRFVVGLLECLKTYLCIVLTVAFLPIAAHLRLAHRLELFALPGVRQNTRRHAAQFVGDRGCRSNESVVMMFRRNVVIVAAIWNSSTAVLEEELL